MELPICNCTNSDDCEVSNICFFTSFFSSLSDLYSNNRQFFWPLNFIIAYITYVSNSKSRTDEKRLPICNGTYSNECDVTDVCFLKGVIGFVNKTGVYIITKGVTFFPPGIFKKGHILPTILLIFCILYFSFPTYIPFSFFSSMFFYSSLLLSFSSSSYPSTFFAKHPKLMNYFGTGNFIHPCNEYMEEVHEFFVGLCHYCKIPGKPPTEPLQRCGSCQLVAYCSITCKNRDRSSHKYVCEEFGLVNGNNALCTTGSWKKHIAGLRERASKLPHAVVAAKPIFRNPPVCHTCRETNPDRLTDCECACVTYCSKKCSRADKKHKEDCSHLSYIAQSYYLCVAADLESLKKKPWFKKIQSSLTNEHMSYPMSLLYALLSLPKCRIGLKDPPLEDLTTLNIHVITNNPILNSKPWELGLMHHLPKLKQLTVVFILQDKALKPSFYQSIKLSGLSLKRCQDCEVKERVIIYSVQQMQYHMYFSSEEYTDPDIVVVYGNKQEMAAGEEGDIHTEISYRNMTYSHDTVLVLMDETMDLVRKGVRDVNAAQPVDQLVSPQINKSRGIGSNRGDVDSQAAIINEKHYFTCLRRK